MANEPRGFKHGRDDHNGRFVPREVAERNRDRYSVEVIPLPGNGDTGRYDKK